jgi:hypothetical protein
MDKVLKQDSSKCITPSSEPFRKEYWSLTEDSDSMFLLGVRKQSKYYTAERSTRPSLITV